MNQSFTDLPLEKQQSIMNAAMEVFATNEYKRASTDLIAAKAGISKGLLFYYFHNKKELYLYLFDYCMKLTKNSYHPEELQRITDFFEILEYGSIIKMKIAAQYPYLTDFILRAFYSQREEVSHDMEQNINDAYAASFQAYFSKLDRSKFKEDTDIFQIYKMMLWMGDGYLNEQRRNGKKLDFEETVKVFQEWMRLFRRIAYRDEFQ